VDQWPFPGRTAGGGVTSLRVTVHDLTAQDREPVAVLKGRRRAYVTGRRSTRRAGTWQSLATTGR
jgi:hypothetical protein